MRSIWIRPFRKSPAPLLVIQSTYLNPERLRVALQSGANTPWFEFVRRSVPTVQIEIISGAGHFTMLDNPQAVNQVLAAFIAKIPNAAYEGTGTAVDSVSCSARGGNDAVQRG